jgi:hypothetical protein
LKATGQKSVETLVARLYREATSLFASDPISRWPGTSSTSRFLIHSREIVPRDSAGRRVRAGAPRPASNSARAVIVVVDVTFSTESIALDPIFIAVTSMNGGFH